MPASRMNRLATSQRAPRRPRFAKLGGYLSRATDRRSSDWPNMISAKRRYAYAYASHIAVVCGLTGLLSGQKTISVVAATWGCAHVLYWAAGWLRRRQGARNPQPAEPRPEPKRPPEWARIPGWVVDGPVDVYVCAQCLKSVVEPPSLDGLDHGMDCDAYGVPGHDADLAARRGKREPRWPST